MAIKSFDKTNLKELRSDINDALAAVAKKHGIALGIGNIQFSGNEFSTRITGTTLGGSKDGTTPTVDPDEVKWRKGLSSFAAEMAGLTLADAGKLFNLDGEQYLLVGFRPKAKRKVVACKPDRKSYIALSHQPVVDALKAA